jgi:transposase
MGGKIPEPIRRKVLIEWLEGHPQRYIARDNQIGIGTVSEIIKTIKERGTETQIDVLREIGVMLRRQGLSIDDFARSIRLNQILNEIGLEEEKVEDFVKHLEIHCFKRRLPPNTFMNLVANISSLSDSLGVPVEELPESIKSSKELLEDTNLTIKNRVLMLKRVNENYNVTMTDLEEYRRDRPLIETLKAKN